MLLRISPIAQASRASQHQPEQPQGAGQIATFGAVTGVLVNLLICSLEGHNLILTLRLAMDLMCLVGLSENAGCVARDALCGVSSVLK